MSNKPIIILCFASAVLCSCAPKPNSSTAASNANLPQIPTVADEYHEQCGDTICQFREKCIDNQCKTKFEMDVYLAPIPKAGDVNDDSYDYWECQSETCTYHTDKTYTIPKGLRVRENYVYCGGEGLPLSKMKDHTCTNLGWVCTSPKGCGECDGEYRYHECQQITCSPGEKCDGGCEFVAGAIDSIFMCEAGNCECGTQRCGKNQICAYGNCYFAGEIRNDYGDSEFESWFDICGTSDTPTQVIRYLSSSCKSEIPPKDPEGYERISPSIGDCLEIDIGLWRCENEKGCQCGMTHCPEDGVCIDGRCALFIGERVGEGSTDASTCATDYPEALSYQPKDSEHYHIAKLNEWPYIRYWGCNESSECVCNGQKLPPDAVCHGTQEGTEYIACAPKGWRFSAFERAPQNLSNYTCKDNKWVCQNDECLCNGKPLPANSYCQDDKIYCYNDEIPTDMTGYECDEKERKWICKTEKCLCGGFELTPNTTCKHWNGADYQCCGIHSYACITAQTASEYECVNKDWVVKAEDGKRHCQDKLLPAGATCSWEYNWGDDDKIQYTEFAECGKDSLYDWEDYTCVDGVWKCALKDKPCMCNGKPLPEGARCIKKSAYCGKDDRDNWEGFSCIDRRWVNDNNPNEASDDPETDVSEDDSETVAKPKDNRCFGHELGKDVICPIDKNDDNFYDYLFNADIEMSDRQSCEHVRGCMCHNQLCPPSGVCTSEGCIDPLTNKPFESKDGYLVSRKLRQCADENGCKCGETMIEYRDYCYDDVQYISLRSCVYNNKRMIVENNYLSYDCENDDVPGTNHCYPDTHIDPEQYLIIDCLVSDSHYFSDRSVVHNYYNLCDQKEGCQCIHNQCKYGEICYKGQCVIPNEYTCHDVADYGEDESKLGKCRPSNSEG